VEFSIQIYIRASISLCVEESSGIKMHHSGTSGDISYSPGAGVPLALPVSILPLSFFFFFFFLGTTAGFAP
jgi:hypothetical protein